MVSSLPASARTAAPAAGRGRLERLEPFALPALAVAVALGVALRLWSTGPLWLDEAQTVQFARVPLADLHEALKTDGAPPLYYALLHGWLDLLATFGVGDSAWAARSLSMVFSLATLPLAYLAGRRLGGSRRHGEIALLLFAVNPWSVRYAGEARMYSLVVLLVLCALLAMERLRRNPGPWPAVALGAVTAALLYTHYWAMFLLVTVGAVLLVRAVRSQEDRRSSRLALTGMAAGGVAFLPWFPTVLYQSDRTGAPWASRPDLGSIAILPAEWWGGFGPVGSTLALLVVPLSLLAVFARRRPGTSTITFVRPLGVTARLAVVAGGTLLVALGICLATGGAVVGRYTAVVVPLVLLLLVFGVLTLPPVAGVSVLATFATLGLLGSLTMATTPHTQAGRIAALLNENSKPGDLVVYCPDQLAPAVESELTATGLEKLTLPAQANPAVVDWTDYEEQIAKLSPRVLADGIADYVQAGSNVTVWYVSGVGYRTHSRVCISLRDRLVAELGIPALVHDRTGRGYEKASLERFRR
ncbi:hypothetical protein GCM10009547_30870 [Sporichthya brevicatena]|uniref:Glycosyltransferase RgtA/B/C/D-like domain-containing protein n=1 Tax=Sporichthya brevicatena TaxID=171442 RepID=A0ABN1H0G1_9ACTN